MWIRDVKIVSQSNVGNGILVTLFELLLWNKKTRYHTTVHKNPITKKDFEDHYTVKNYQFCTLKAAEQKFEIMTMSNVEVKSI